MEETSIVVPLNIILLQDCLANGMPGAKELAKYFDVQDKYGVRVGDWAMQAAPGVASSCSICPDVRVKFGKGKEMKRVRRKEHHEEMKELCETLKELPDE